MALVLEKYKKGWLLKGDTKPFKETLKTEYNGSWNKTLGGWVFSPGVIEKLTHFVDLQNTETKTETKKNYRSMFEETMQKCDKRNGQEFGPVRIISYKSFITDDEKEFIYGACTWCKSNSDDSCVILLVVDGKIFPRPVCPDCGYKLVTNSKQDETKCIAENDWFKRTPFIVQGKNDASCDFCKQDKATCMIVSDENQAGMCKNCACCWMFFY